MANRSRSPKTNASNSNKVDEPVLSFDTMWNQMEPKLDDFKTSIKQVVGVLVNQEVARIEAKIDSNQKSNDTKFESLETKFDTMQSTFDSKLSKIEKAISDGFNPLPMASSVAGSSGDRGGASGAPTYASVSSNGAGVAPPFMVDDVTTPTFHRKPDPTKLYCNVHDKTQVSKSKFHEAVVPLVLDAGLKETDVSIVGDALDFRFELLFSGDTRTASVKTKQFYESLQLGRGKWKVQEVPDDTGHKHQFYVAPDKNPAQMRKEVLTKRIQTILASMSPNKQFFSKKSIGSVYCDRRVVVTVQITGEESARLCWCHAKRIELGIDQASAEEQFAQYIVAGGSGS
jgi:hypothetical protein